MVGVRVVVMGRLSSSWRVCQWMRQAWLRCGVAVGEEEHVLEIEYFVDVEWVEVAGESVDIGQIGELEGRLLLGCVGLGFGRPLVVVVMVGG